MDDASDDGGPAMPPRGVTGRRRGWQGEELEMAHQATRTDEHHQTVAAVDIRQFQNTVVGEGYQARHVVRQPSASSPAAKTKDMTGGADMKETKKSTTLDAYKYTGGNKYIENAGLRQFRREIEDILSSS
jgi:hypothetical protein